MVQAAGAVNRDQVKADLLALANEHIGNWEQYADKEFTSNEYGFTYTSRQTELNGITLTVSKATVPGLTLDMHRQFRSNLATIMPKMDDKLKIVECPAVDGLRAII